MTHTDITATDITATDITTTDIMQSGFSRRLRSLDLAELFALDLKPRGMVLEPIIPEKAWRCSMPRAAPARPCRARHRLCGRDRIGLPQMAGAACPPGAAGRR